MPIKLGRWILGGKIMNREEGHHSGQPVCLHCGSHPCDRLFRDSDFHRRRNGLRLICGCVRYADGRILAEIYQAPQKTRIAGGHLLHRRCGFILCGTHLWADLCVSDSVGDIWITNWYWKTDWKKFGQSRGSLRPGWQKSWACPGTPSAPSKPGSSVRRPNWRWSSALHWIKNLRKYFIFRQQEWGMR